LIDHWIISWDHLKADRLIEQKAKLKIGTFSYHGWPWDISSVGRFPYIIFIVFSIVQSWLFSIPQFMKVVICFGIVSSNQKVLCTYNKLQWLLWMWLHDISFCK
jgi:hypothetical protein